MIGRIIERLTVYHYGTPAISRTGGRADVASKGTCYATMSGLQLSNNSFKRTALLLTARENLRHAAAALSRNWQRTTLTMSGITVGVISIVTLVAIMKGVQVEIRNQVEGLGANLAVIVPGKLDENGQPNPGALIGISTLSDKDVEALKKVPGVKPETVSPVSLVAGLAEYGKDAALKSSGALVVSTTKQGVVLNPSRLVAGRYFNDDEQHVCILSEKPRKDLFGETDPIGKFVSIAGKQWKVVGVLGKPPGDGGLGSMVLGLATLVYLPMNEVRVEMPSSQVNRIVLQTDYKGRASDIINAMHAAMMKTHGGHEDFGIITSEKALAIVIKFLTLAQDLLVLIAAISLFVAGVSIMNIMLVTVSERTREIGIRKTVGARNSDIFTQFLMEAIILSLAGCIVGVAVSAAIGRAIAHFTALNPVITLSVVLQAAAACIFVGVVFGVTPAMRASRLNPIEALRHE
jgi:putative ABC transport system permease protein